MKNLMQGFRNLRTLILLAVALLVGFALGRDSIVATLYGQAAPAAIQAEYTLAPGAPISKLTTQFLYQGNLAVSGEAANGAFNFGVRLYNAESGGEQIGPENSFDGVELTGGTFSLYLDYGDVFNGEMRWLEIDVQGEGEAGFTTLSPRQAVNPVPYALYAESTLETWQMNRLVADDATGLVRGGVFGYPSLASGEPDPNPAIILLEVALVPKQVEHLYIIGYGSGEFQGDFTIEFEARGFDGSFKRTVSAEPFDLSLLPTSARDTSVIEIAVSTNPQDRIVLPNEYLAIKVVRDGEAQPGSFEAYLNPYAMVRNAVLPDVENDQ